MMQKNTLAPIALFVYNRPDHTAQTIAALQKNNLAKDSELFIFCDGPKNEEALTKIAEVYKIVENISGFKNVVIKKLNLNRGLANSIISGIGDIINKYGKVIVLEDDIVTSPYFLQFMNDGLQFYQDDKRIFSITGFNHPQYQRPADYKQDVFFASRVSSWGWAAWKDRWDLVDFKVKDYELIKNNQKIQKKFRKNGDNFFEMLSNQMAGRIDTWDIQVCWHMFKNQLYCVYPIKTLVKNIGLDSSGVHCSSDKAMMNFDLESGDRKINLAKFDSLHNNKFAEKEFLKYTKYSAIKKFISSRKKRIKIKYILFGMIFAELLRFLFV